MKHSNHKIIQVKTGAWIFEFEFSSKGIYAVRFPVNAQQLTENGSVPRAIGARCTLSVAPQSSLQVVLLKKIANEKLDLTGYTSFQRRVYEVLRKIPAGQTITYSELAKRAGYPGAARAVGSAMKKNRLPIVIPCHRVVPAAGGVGEYSAGKQWKKLLLGQEGYPVKKTPRCKVATP